MSDWDTYTCEGCGVFGNTVDPVTGQQMGEKCKGEMLCPTCRVDKRLQHGDFSNEH